MKHALALAFCIALLACSNDDGEHANDAQVSADAEDAGTTLLTFLTPTQHLLRASMALRGIRPSLEELAAVRKNPKYVAAIVDYYLDRPELGETMRELHAQDLLVGVDPVIYPAGFPARGKLAGLSTQAVNQSVIEAPLRLIEHVITSDRPYSEIVTADYAFADRTVATVWGMPYDDEGSTWQETHYDDERPTAGILSDSFLFTRHGTTYSNLSRGRANLISRALLCNDFLARDIAIDTSIDLSDSKAVTNAVQNNPACAACHQALDPLAAYFAPFRPIYVPSNIEEYPYSTYLPGLQKTFSITTPGYFGADGHDLRDLGKKIAADPAFTKCAVKRFYSFFAQVRQEDMSPKLIEKLRSSFVKHDLSAKALARAVVLSDEFRATGPDHEDLKVTPEALARTIEDLTGFRWQTTLPYEINEGEVVGDVDLMTDAFFGFKVLAGGIDGNSVTLPSRALNPTTMLVLQGLAARASKAVVEADFNRADKHTRHLLRNIDEDDTSETSVRAQLADLELRLFGEVVPSDDAQVDDSYSLFSSVLEQSGARRAWTLTLYALLQDPRMVYY